MPTDKNNLVSKGENKNFISAKLKKMVALLSIFVLASTVITGNGSDDLMYTVVNETYELPLAGASTLRSGEVRTEISGTKTPYTVLIYVCGSNLESGYDKESGKYIENAGGMASRDMIEMANAKFGDNVNLILQLGGSGKWHINGIDSKSVGRYQIKDGKLKKIEDVGKVAMTDKKTLSEFLQWGVKNYPSDRYAVVLWDHGGGTLFGYGSDEYYPNETLSVEELKWAFDQVNTKFDFIGFDACLMATLEIAQALKDSSDYLIASEENEAGTGWYYTDWITALGNDPGMPIEQIGRNIISGFLDDNGRLTEKYGEKSVATLSLIDMSKTDKAISELTKFYNKLLKVDGSIIANARNSCREYGKGRYEMVDAIDFIDKTEVSGYYDAKRALMDCVLYCDSNISGSNGISIYFPSKKLGYYTYASSMLKRNGYSKDYFKLFNSYATLMADNAEGDNPYTNEAWYGQTGSTQTAEAVQLDGDKIKFVGYKGNKVVKLTEDDWKAISDVQLNLVLRKDSTDYFLSNDIYSYYDEEGNLAADFNGKWVTVNGIPIDVTIADRGLLDDGRIKTLDLTYACLYNSQFPKGKIIQIAIMAVIDKNNNRTFEILGYLTPDDEDTNLFDRNLYNLNENDTVQFLVYAVDVTGEKDPEFVKWYSPQTYGKNGFTIKYSTVPNTYQPYVGYTITDIYNNKYNTGYTAVEVKY